MPTRLTHLTADLRSDPLGIDVPHPRLGWHIESDQRGLRQRAFQVLVASTPGGLARDQGDLWDSGRVESDASVRVAYAGQGLASNRQVWWKVRIWDQDDRPVPWSDPATWTMGVMNADDWAAAQWITSADIVEQAKTPPRRRVRSPGLLLRREFEVRRDVTRVLINVSGLGSYTLFVDGKRVSPDVLEPGWTDYRKTVLYQVYDLTPLVAPGLTHSVCVSLGHGVYDISNAPDGRFVKFSKSFGPIKAIALLRLQRADGSAETIGSDERWRTTPGPVTFDHLYAGEDHDGRLELPGWDRPGTAADVATTAAVVTPAPGGTLRGLSCAAPPVRTHDVLPPQTVTTHVAGVVIYDFGQNTAMMPRLACRGMAGAAVRMIPSELLDRDGVVDRASSTQDGVRPAWWQYTLKGDGVEEFFPQFYYHGARYLQAELIPAPGSETFPTVERLDSVVVHSASTPTGQFSTSNELFNRIYRLIRWAQRSNMFSVMTDCPHREKMPWLEETHLNGPALRYNFDMAPLLAKLVNDTADAQLASGFVPNIAPEFFMAQPKVTDPFRNSPEWGSAMLLVAWQQFEFTGDIDLFQRYYEPMKRYVAFLESTADNHIVRTGLGDWCDIGPKPSWGSQLTPPAFTATAFYYHDTQTLGRIATLLGKPDEAEAFDRKAGVIRDAFNAEFWNAQTGQYVAGAQTCNAIPLVMNLARPEHRARLLDAVIRDVQANGLTSGDVGYRYLLRALADGGRSDVIYAMNNQTTRPGYGMQLAKGATALTEKWSASVDDFGSHNHFMLGQLNEWLFHDLAGIRFDPDAPGYKRVVIQPAILADLTFAEATTGSPYGPIRSRWEKRGDDLTLEVSIPPNTRATLRLPAAADRITESGTPARQADGVTAAAVDGGLATIEIGSGHYRFVIAGPAAT